ncbi:response regulator transcription factor [Sphingomonas cavernae]|uniref:DNA-binding response regulator n=1 Tax=Sphingomonas cavernae TaxID=2320861 RepID=A0A418WJN3_9SPHN|nr:response regulator transcription factor [Sphingomonas cavernae]RJF90256.1 DNA-binding response regulator [Sphingomonas cavernae]
MKLAVVDDNADDAAYVGEMLRSADHHVETFVSVEEFRRRVRRHTFDLAIFDWNMPEMSGLELVAWLRETGAPTLPVIMATARFQTQDIATALEAGADDYMTKPLERELLLARIKAVAGRTIARLENETITLNEVMLQGASGQAWLSGDEVSLTAKEFQLAAMLLTNLGRPLSRTYLLETTWGKSPNVFTRTLDAHISKVRTKLDLRPQRGFALTTINGFGYRLELVE